MSTPDKRSTEYDDITTAEHNQFWKDEDEQHGRVAKHSSSLASLAVAPNVSTPERSLADYDDITTAEHNQILRSWRDANERKRKERSIEPSLPRKQQGMVDSSFPPGNQEAVPGYTMPSFGQSQSASQSFAPVSSGLTDLARASLVQSSSFSSFATVPFSTPSRSQSSQSNAPPPFDTNKDRLGFRTASSMFRESDVSNPPVGEESRDFFDKHAAVEQGLDRAFATRKSGGSSFQGNSQSQQQNMLPTPLASPAPSFGGMPPPSSWPRSPSPSKRKRTQHVEHQNSK
jgi:hypothetical protein